MDENGCGVNAAFKTVDSKSKLADVLDGRTEPEIYEDEIARTSMLGDSSRVENGVASSVTTGEAVHRRREVMLLRAVAEKYGKSLAKEGTSADSLIREFLGPEPNSSNDKNSSARGAVDVDMMDEDNEAMPASSSGGSKMSNLSNNISSLVGKKVKEANIDLIERSKHVPLRLTLEERKLLRLCEAALDVSEYTDKVDVLSWKSKTGRIHEQIRDICAVLSGLAVAADYEVGQKMIKDRSFEDNAEYFAAVFEIGRRHKILNPERYIQ